MGQAYQSDTPEKREGFALLEREKRRRTFERYIMTPVSWGTLAAFVGYAAHEIFDRATGTPTSKNVNTYVFVGSAAVAGVDFLATLIGWRLRK